MIIIVCCIFRKLRIWSHLLKKSLMGNFIFCAVIIIRITSKRWPIGTTNCLSLSDHFVGLALKGLISCIDKIKFYLGLIKLRIAFLNSRNHSVFLISSMSLAHFLTVHGSKHDKYFRSCWKFLYPFVLLTWFECFLYQSNSSTTVDMKVEDLW